MLCLFFLTFFVKIRIYFVTSLSWTFPFLLFLKPLFTYFIINRKPGGRKRMKKILLIDDEFIFRQGLKYLMDWESSGYTIVGEASNGQEGLEKYFSLQPDAILCDVVMPVLGGVEFVRNLRKISQVPVVMLSNFDEFDKVRQAFQYGASDYLLKSRVTAEELLDCLNRITDDQSSALSGYPAKSFGLLARQILDGYAASCSEPFKNWLSDNLPGDQYALLIIEQPAPDFSSEEDLQARLRRLLPEYPLYACYTTQSHALALMSLDPDSISGLSRVPLKLNEAITHTCCVLGLPFSDISLFREKAENLYELTRCSILYEHQLCFYEPELAAPHAKAPSFPSEDYTRLADQGYWPEAGSLLIEYMESVKNSTAVSPFRFQKLIEHTFYSSLKSARKFAKDSSAVSRTELKLFKELDQALTYVQFKEAVSCAYQELEEICMGNIPSCDQIISHFQEYLEEHYAEQITLYDVANHLHMNYSYLSSYISQNTGKHFSEHLNDVRIRHARLLLTETSLSISQISENIGYSDQSYFGKIFKKLAGMTPLQYRSQTHRKENS